MVQIKKLKTDTYKILEKACKGNGDMELIWKSAFPPWQGHAQSDLTSQLQIKSQHNKHCLIKKIMVRENFDIIIVHSTATQIIDDT